MKTIVLASASPRRKELLEKAGIPFVIKPCDVDESTELTEPEEVVRELSKRKCLCEAKSENDGVFLGADTVVANRIRNGWKILGKPSDEEDAVRMLRSLRGHEHQVWTGVTMAEKRDGTVLRTVTEAVKTIVTVAPMTDDEIRDYVNTREPMDKAGAYGIQGLFSKFIEKIDGSYSSVVGLPVNTVYKILTMWEL